MGWMTRERAVKRFWRQPNWQVEIESTEMREELGLRFYLEPRDEHLAPAELGRRIDDCLVEYTRTYFLSLRLGNTSIEEFKSKMGKIEQGMRDDPALKAFEVAIWEEAKVPLDSRTYLKLAIRYLRRKTNEGSAYSQRLPEPTEGCQFARMMLDQVMIKAKWKHAWDRELLIRRGADDWLRKRDEYGLWKLIRASQKSALAWDTLELICEELAHSGEERPDTLLHWAFDVVSGSIKRPDEDPVPLGRPPKVGYKLRDNEIRHTVDLLVLVGMSKTAACEAVEKACWDLEGSLDFITISRIYREPYWTIADIEDDVRKLLEPSYHEYSHMHEAEAQFFKDMIAEFIAVPGDTPDEPPLDPLPPSQAQFEPELWEEGPHGRKYIGGGSREEQLDALRRALSGKQG